MKPRFDLQAAKRAVDLSLNAELVERARTLTDNLSGQVELLLVASIERCEAERQGEADLLERAARSWDEFTERHGSFADEFSTL